MKKPVIVALSGAAGQIAYHALFSIASGNMLGPDQPVILHLLDIPEMEKVACGTMLELEDGNFPLLYDIHYSNDPEIAYRDAQYALLFCSSTFRLGMMRRDFLANNIPIFAAQGRALDKVADRTVKILVVANPANTGAYVVMQSAKSLPSQNITALMRLDHNRAVSQLAFKLKQPSYFIQRLCVWGNHSSTMYADYRFATLGDQSIAQLVNDEKWYQETYLPLIANRGYQIVQVRGNSSVASAAKAAIDHMHDWVNGTEGHWVTMAVVSDGSYDIPQNLIYGMPVTCTPHAYHIVPDLPMDEMSRLYFKRNIEEIQEEYEAVRPLV